MAEVVFNGKTYKDIDMDAQKALHVVSIHTFRYFPKDKVWMASDMTKEVFGLDKFYCIGADCVGPGIVAEEDAEKDRNAYIKIVSGQADEISYEIHLKNRYTIFRITLAVLEKDENGSPEIVAGIIEDYDEQMMQAATAKMLSNDYFSVYYVDFVRDEVFIVKMLESLKDRYENTMRQKPSYKASIAKYIEEDVIQEERNEMEKITSYENLSKELASDKLAFLHDYHVFRDGKTLTMNLKVVKLNDGPELRQAVVGFSDVSDEQQKKLARLAYFDQVTMGNNYNYYSELLRKENRTGYVVSLDIRDFKVVNNVCGIKCGDTVLREVNDILGDVIGDKGYYAHVNGDHFVAFLPYDTEEEIIAVLDKIIEEFNILVEENDFPKISPYFGAARWTPGERIQLVFSQANTAKHKIKPNKDIYYGFYSDLDTQAAIEIKKIEDAFEGAVSNNEFEIWYQPKYSPIDKELTGAEALVRWRKSDGTLFPPGKFIPVYENNGMIRRLDEYVFTKVCIQQKDWIDKFGKCVPVSVNLSRASLSYETIVEDYKNIADEIGIPSMIIPIEITESAAISNDDIKDLADRFFEAGFPLHIDDFGTGYSSLSTLNLMKFDTLKLDKSLIDYIGEFGGDRLIKHTVALAKDLGLFVTAEGVEEYDQLQFLKEVECDSIQGYVYSKPVEKVEFEKILESEKVSDKCIYTG